MAGGTPTGVRPVFHGLGISGYRSFGPTVQRLGPLAKVNLLIGPNDSGKSTFLRFLERKAQGLFPCQGPSQGVGLREVTLDEQERHLGHSFQDLTMEIGLDVSRLDSPEVAERLPEPFRAHLVKVKDVLCRSLRTGPDDRWGPMLWQTFTAHGSLPAPSGGLHLEPTYTEFAKTLARSPAISPTDWKVLAAAVSRHCSRDEERPATGQRLAEFIMQQLYHGTLQVTSVPTTRKVDSGESSLQDREFTGKGIARHLAKLKHPSPEAWQDKDTFKAFAEFVRSVLQAPEVDVDVARDPEELLLVHNGLPLRLSAHGTGIEQLVLLAAAATTRHGQFVTLEEPEINIHPLLQRLLIRYLVEHTDNTYFIATHSAHLIDTPGAAIFHFRLVDGQTIVTPAQCSAQRFAVCEDLGYRASDLLQSNFIIWVEGPSDRIYLRHWIRQLDPVLEEGIHYSVMFYGGRLLSHLTASDDERASDLVELRRINRNMAVVIDSDRSQETTPLNLTKTRLLEEFKDEPGLAWVTDGHAIENYCHAGTFAAAVQRAHPSASAVTDSGRFAHMSSEATIGVKCPLKMKIAHAYVELIEAARATDKEPTVAQELATLGLEDRVRALCAVVRRANGLPATDAPGAARTKA